MFAKPLTTFCMNIESLRDFVDVPYALLEEEAQNVVRERGRDMLPLLLAFQELGIISDFPEEAFLSREQIERLIASSISMEISETEDGKGVTLNVQGEAGTRFHESIIAFIRARRRIKLLHSGSLMNLTSIVELFFSQLLHAYYASHPEILPAKEKLFSLEDLAAFDSIADARLHYVSSKIEDIIRSSFSGWLAFLKNTAKLSMGYLQSDIDKLVETFQRRNAVVHTGGVANSIYLSRVAEDLKQGVRAGQQLDVGPQYLHARIDLFERACVLVAAELWKKLHPMDCERATVLQSMVSHHLKEERWIVAEGLAFFLAQDKQLREKFHLSARLDYWYCKKQQGLWDEVRKEVACTDFSAKSLRFQMAFAALNGRADEFFELVPRVLQAGEMSTRDLAEDPVSGALREDPRFLPYKA